LFKGQKSYKKGQNSGEFKLTEFEEFSKLTCGIHCTGGTGEFTNRRHSLLALIANGIWMIIRAHITRLNDLELLLAHGHSVADEGGFGQWHRASVGIWPIVAAIAAGFDWQETSKGVLEAGNLKKIMIISLNFGIILLEM
jgi:hypothetical protein